MSSNRDKSKHGKDAQYALESILKRCKDENYVAEITTHYRAGREGFGNEKQFYAPFMILFEDGSKWALFTSTSMRTDRVKGQQWDAANLKAIDPYITKAFLVYSDSVSDTERFEFERQNKKYKDKKEFSAIDAIVSQDEMSNLIETYSLSAEGFGYVKDKQGNSFERRIADILSYERNLRKWLYDDRTIEGMHYDIFRQIINSLGIPKSGVTSIQATSDKMIIGKLPSGGNPKTDVLVTAIMYDGSSRHYTISCKRSSASLVSVHQYSADCFADVLNAKDNTLRILLRLFQTVGNLRDFGEENCIELKRALLPYVRQLAMWVLGGHGGDGNPETQNANYILVYNNNDSTTSIHTVNEYIDHLMHVNTSGHFGTPFSWTYPSKRKGESIQLKCRIIK